MAIHRIVTVSKILLQCNRSSIICTNVLHKHQINSIRLLTIDQPKKANALKQEKEKVHMFIVQRYIDYVKSYMKVLETRFPTAMNMYRVFSIGIKDFLRDLKTYISLKMRIAKDKGFANMTRQDIELYQKMPSDMWRIAPVLILSAVPFGNYIIFPLAFLKPKKLLCSHFWSIQQRAEFLTQDLTDRLRNNRPVFRALQAKLDSIPNGESKEKWRRVLALLGSGVHPTPNEILTCKDLFSREPYALTNLTYAHMGHLLKLHGLRKTLLRKQKLKYRAFLLIEMDKAIIREGGVAELTTEALRNACHLRGLNSSNLSNQDMKKWLQSWLTISEYVDKTNYSLILHCPIFLGYNHPQNWVLVYSK